MEPATPSHHEALAAGPIDDTLSHVGRSLAQAGGDMIQIVGLRPAVRASGRGPLSTLGFGRRSDQPRHQGRPGFPRKASHLDGVLGQEGGRPWIGSVIRIYFSV